jgi:hypothetical protein
MASATAKAMPIIQIRTIWSPRLCSCRNGAGKNASRHQLPLVAEDTAFASINGVPKSGASALSLGVDYRRHQLVYKFDRKQISARHGPSGLVPQFVDQCSSANERDARRGGRRSQRIVRPAFIIRYPTVQNPRSRAFVCNHFRSPIRPPEKGRQNLSPNRPTRSPLNYRF